MPAWPLTPVISYTLIRISSYQVWRPYGICKQFDLFDPSWPVHDLWPQQRIKLWSGVLPTRFGGHGSFLSKLTLVYPQLTPAWPVTPAMLYTLVRASSKFSSHMAFVSNFTFGWPQLTPTRPLTTSCITLWSGILCTKLGGHRAFFYRFDLWLTPADPCMTFDPSNKLHLDQDFFQPNLAAMRHL